MKITQDLAKTLVEKAIPLVKKGSTPYLNIKNSEFVVTTNKPNNNYLSTKWFFIQVSTYLAKNCTKQELTLEVYNYLKGVSEVFNVVKQIEGAILQKTTNKTILIFDEKTILEAFKPSDHWVNEGDTLVFTTSNEYMSHTIHLDALRNRLYTTDTPSGTCGLSSRRDIPYVDQVEKAASDYMEYVNYIKYLQSVEKEFILKNYTNR